ncbi:hypothetical protein AL577_22925 [Escherichia coli]|nr:hypothetical protein [Escherichia coli]
MFIMVLLENGKGITLKYPLPVRLVIHSRRHLLEVFCIMVAVVLVVQVTVITWLKLVIYMYSTSRAKLKPLNLESPTENRNSE